MKRCPSCNRTYTDEALSFCLEDGTPLLIEAPTPATAGTLPYPPPRDTDPPPTQVYHPSAAIPAQPPALNLPPSYQPRYSPLPMAQRRKSHAVWWILGGLAVITILGIGLVVILIAIASMSSDSNSNRSNTNNSNLNTNNANRSTNANSTNSNYQRDNADSNANLPASASDDFSSQLWGAGTSQYGETWYANGEYHMRSKDKTYLVMYGPNTTNYNTENATVSVTVQNVDGISPVYGYGMLVHCEKSKDKKELEDYGFLIRTGDSPAYEIVMHKGGKETKLVDWTTASNIRTGTSSNKIEVRIKDRSLSLYLNDQYATSITDAVPFKRGLVGFYSSDAHEVAFDDLGITR